MLDENILANPGEKTQGRVDVTDEMRKLKEERNCSASLSFSGLSRHLTKV